MLGLPFFRRKTSPELTQDQETPAPGEASPDRGPFVIREWSGPGSIVLQSLDPRHEASLELSGVFEDDQQRYAYANALVNWLNQQLATAQIQHIPKSPPVTAADFAAHRIESDAELSALGLGAEGILVADYVPDFSGIIPAAQVRSIEPSMVPSAAEAHIPPTPDVQPSDAVPTGLLKAAAEEPQIEEAPKPTNPSIAQKVTRLLTTSSWPALKHRVPGTAEDQVRQEPELATAIEETEGKIEPSMTEAHTPEPDQGSRGSKAGHRPGKGKVKSTTTSEPKPTAAEPAAPTPAAPATEKSAVPAQSKVAWGCHCDLAPGQYPDACVLDLGQPEYCSIASSGVRKDACVHWQPIKIVKNVA